MPVTLDVQTNLAQMRAVLAQAQPQDLVVFPEGALSGYAEDPRFLDALNPLEIEAGRVTLAREAHRRQIHLFFGSCLLEAGQWVNAGIYLGPGREQFIYRKVNLATRERGAFVAGAALQSLDLLVDGSQVRVAMQLCRELRFPEQWQALARQGAQVFVFLTHALDDVHELPVWRAHLMSRAAENQRFVLASNAAGAAPKCPTLVAAPSGRVLAEAGDDSPATLRVTLDLGQTSNWYLDQARRDVVGVDLRSNPPSE